MARCKSCGAEIDWVTMPKSGKKMPVDVPAVRFTAGGNETFVTRDGEVVRGTRTDWAGGQAGWIPHFATCPNADRHRRGKG